MKNLKELVGINSYTEGSQIVDYLKDRFKNYAEEIIELKNEEDNNKSLIIGINTKLKDCEPIILSGHIDTVNPDEKNYKTNPLKLTILNDKAYGLGAIDMKAFTAVILDKIEEIIAMDKPVLISLTTDEETKLNCINNISKKLQQLNIKPKFTIVGEPTNTEIKNVSNGCYEYQLEVFGKSCHSSILDNGINSINIIARLINFIEEEQKNISNLTSNVGIISGGDIVNRVPAYCRINFDIRSTEIAKVNSFIDVITCRIKELENQYIGSKIELKKLLEIPPLEEKNVDKIKNLASELNLKISKFSGGCEAGYYQNISGDAIIFGVGDIDLAHKPNEYVDINEYKNYSEILMKLLEKIIKNYY